MNQVSSYTGRNIEYLNTSVPAHQMKGSQDKELKSPNMNILTTCKWKINNLTIFHKDTADCCFDVLNCGSSNLMQITHQQTFSLKDSRGVTRSPHPSLFPHLHIHELLHFHYMPVLSGSLNI